jgi:hypothetical protein
MALVQMIRPNTKVSIEKQRIERELVERYDMVRAALRSGHGGVKLGAKVVSPRFRLRNNRDLKIVDAEFRHMALLLVVGRVSFDLEGNASVRHGTHVRFKEKMPLVLRRRLVALPESEICIRPDREFSVAWRFDRIPKTRLVVLPLNKLQRPVPGEEQEFRVDA